MSSRSTRIKLGAITLGIGAAALAVPATASAAPATTPVPGTNCTLGQVERSIGANAPEVSRYLDNPRIRAEFERIVTLPDAARRAEAEQYLNRYPQLRQYRPAIEDRIAVIEDTCSRF